jgi:hypothetical protein
MTFHVAAVAGDGVRQTGRPCKVDDAVAIPDPSPANGAETVARITAATTRSPDLLLCSYDSTFANR